MIKFLILGIGLLAIATILIPTRAMADYTCWNPAICIAVCGSATCKDSAAAVNVESLKSVPVAALNRELTNAPRNSNVRDAASAALQSRDTATRAAYTCWNPAICIAVCGSKTCGE